MKTHAERPVGGATPARLNSKPSWLIRDVAAHASQLVASGFAAAGARSYHYRVLAALEEFGPKSQAALGRSIGMDPSDVVAMLNELAEKGLIERTSDPSDRRRNSITITPAGTQHLQVLDAVVAGIQDELLAPLSADERGDLSRLLSKLLDHSARGEAAS